MDTEAEVSSFNRINALGLSPADFRKYLLDERYVTELELVVNPGIVAKLMDDDSIWDGYVEDRENAYKTHLDDERDRASI